MFCHRHARIIGPFFASSLLLLSSACSSSTHQDAVSSQLAELQRQVLQLQTQAAGKQELDELAQALAGGLQQLILESANGRSDRESFRGELERLSSVVNDSLGLLRELKREVESARTQIEELEAALPAASSPVALDQSQLYESSYGALLRGDCELAINGFRLYVDSFVASDQADNAQYWIGECHFSQGKHRDAIREFVVLQERFPASEKLASAFLRTAQAWLELGDMERARTALQTVLQRYPRSDEAVLAQQRLQAMR